MLPELDDETPEETPAAKKSRVRRVRCTVCGWEYASDSPRPCCPHYLRHLRVVRVRPVKDEPVTANGNP